MRRLLHTLFGLLALASAAVLFAPRLAAVIARQSGMELTLEETPIRVLGAIGLVIAIVARLMLNPGKGRSKTEIAWAEFANETGGALTTRPTAHHWLRGTAVQWTVRGVPVILSQHLQEDTHLCTRFASDLSLAQPFQFWVMPETFVTKALSSPKLWAMTLEAAKREAVRQGGKRLQAVERMAFLAGKDVLIGDPLFDDAFLVKSEEVERARDLFSDSGVAHWMRELLKVSKGWTFSLLATDAANGHQLALDVTGLEGRPELLRAGHSLLDAAIGRIRDRRLLEKMAG